MSLNMNARYSDLLSIKRSRESAAEVKLMQAHRKLQDAVSEEASANNELQEWTNKCQLREQELYDKLLAGGTVKLSVNVDQAQISKAISLLHTEGLLFLIHHCSKFSLGMRA